MPSCDESVEMFLLRIEVASTQKVISYFFIISDKTLQLTQCNDYRRQRRWLRTYYENIKLFDQQIWLF